MFSLGWQQSGKEKNMHNVYEKRPILFAVLWIVVYCFVMAPIRGNYGDASIVMLLGLLAFTAGIIVFVKICGLKEECGLAGWPKEMKKFLFFLPMWILATGNLWDGFALSYQGLPLLYATISMILVGFVEEMIFRGFLFKAMLSKGRPVVAVIISALTFGMGHIVNLFTGQASLETVMQMIFAVSWGFILTMVFYKGGSLIPCIIAHAMIDVFSLYGADNPLIDNVYIGVTIVVAVIYCIYLAKLKNCIGQRITEIG